MSEHRHPRIAHGAEEPPGLLLLREPETGVHGRDDDVEPLQELVPEVDGAIGQDVRLGAVEDPQLRKPRTDRPDLGALLRDALRRQPSRVPRPLAVIGNRAPTVPGTAPAPERAP